MNSMELVEETIRLMNQLTVIDSRPSGKSGNSPSSDETVVTNVPDDRLSIAFDENVLRPSNGVFTSRTRWSTWKPRKPESIEDCKLLKKVQSIECEADFSETCTALNEHHAAESPTGMLTRPASVSRKHAIRSRCVQDIDNRVGLSSDAMARQPQKAFLFASSSMPIVMAAASCDVVSPDCRSAVASVEFSPSKVQQSTVEKYQPVPKTSTYPQASQQSESVDDKTSVLHVDTDIIEPDSIESSDTEEMFKHQFHYTSPAKSSASMEDRFSDNHFIHQSALISEKPLLKMFRTARSHSSPARSDMGSLRSILKGQTTPIRNSLEKPSGNLQQQNGEVNGLGNGINSIEAEANGSWRGTDLSNLILHNLDSERSSSPRKSVRFADENDEKGSDIGQNGITYQVPSRTLKTNGPVLSVIPSSIENNRLDSPVLPTSVDIASNSKRLPTLESPISNGISIPNTERQIPTFIQIPKKNEPSNPPVFRSAHTLPKRCRPFSFHPDNGSKTGYADLLVGRPKKQSDSDDYVFVNSHSTWAPSINNKILPPPKLIHAQPTPDSINNLPPKPSIHYSVHHYSSPRPVYNAKTTRPLSQLYTTSKLDEITTNLRSTRAAKPTVQPGLSFPDKMTDAEKLAKLARLTELNYETSLAKPVEKLPPTVDKEDKQSDYEGVDGDSMITTISSRGRVLHDMPHSIYLKGCNGIMDDTMMSKSSDSCVAYTPRLAHSDSLTAGRAHCVPHHTGEPLITSNEAGDSGEDHDALPVIIPIQDRLLQRRPQLSQRTANNSNFYERSTTPYQGSSNAQNARPPSALYGYRSGIPTPMSAPTMLPSRCTNLRSFNENNIHNNNNNNNKNNVVEYSRVCTPYEFQPSCDTPIIYSAKPNSRYPGSEPLRRKQYVETAGNILSDSLTEFLESERACNQTVNGLLKIARPPESIRCQAPLPKPRCRRRREISSLSIEEARLIKSLDRLNSRLYDDPLLIETLP